MRLLAWLLRLALFLVIFWIALKNTTPVPLRLTATRVYEAVPLVVVILVSVCVGVVAAIVSLLPTLARMRRRIARLNRLATRDGGEAERAGERLAAAARNIGAVGQLDVDTRLRRE
ncbi:MAG TPA: lipopolysaccharide assembly protein LapA domain-containing protein [Burkholderiaceae bacterium]|nr:lipopolysaccharide assembly protein LapA domain-containing protein [Burkholderiaceae bacterium]